MGVVKKKHAATSPVRDRIGRKFLRYIFGDTELRFHEELICANSNAVRRSIHKNRKLVDGECSICQEELDKTDNRLTFCRYGCGQNFHDVCINQWLGDRTVTAGNCPTCRGVWKSTTSTTPLNEFHLLLGLHEWAMEIYHDWLYTGEIEFQARIDTDNQDLDTGFIQALGVSDILEDSRFQHALVASYVNTCLDNPDEPLTKLGIASAWSSGLQFLKDFAIDASVAGFALQEQDHSKGDYPEGFLYELASSLIHSKGEKRDYGWLLEKYAGGAYAVEEDENQAVTQGREDDLLKTSTTMQRSWLLLRIKNALSTITHCQNENHPKAHAIMNTVHSMASDMHNQLWNN